MARSWPDFLCLKRPLFLSGSPMIHEDHPAGGLFGVPEMPEVKVEDDKAAIIQTISMTLMHYVTLCNYVGDLNGSSPSSMRIMDHSGTSQRIS